MPVNTYKQPTVAKWPVATNAWIVSDDFGNPVHEGECVFVLEAGDTIHVDAAEDFLIEKQNAKAADILNWEGKAECVFLFPNGTWVRVDDIEDYFVDVLGAQVFERRSVLPKQK